MSVMFGRQDSLPIASGNIPRTTGTTMSQSMKSPTLQHGSEVQRLPASQKPCPSSLQGSAQHRAITITTTLTRFDSGRTWTETTLGVCAGFLAAPMPRAYFDRVHVTCKAETSADSAMKRFLHIINDGTAWVRGQEGSKATFIRLSTSPMGRGDSSLALQPTHRARSHGRTPILAFHHRTSGREL